MASAQEYVSLMTELVADGEVAFEEKHGSAALDVAQEIRSVLMSRLEGNLGHVVLWEQYLRTPEDVADALVGVIQLHIDQDEVLAGWLDDAVARYEMSAGGKDR